MAESHEDGAVTQETRERTEYHKREELGGSFGNDGFAWSGECGGRLERLVGRYNSLTDTGKVFTPEVRTESARADKGDDVQDWRTERTQEDCSAPVQHFSNLATIYSTSETDRCDYPKKDQISAAMKVRTERFGHGECAPDGGTAESEPTATSPRIIPRSKETSRVSDKDYKNEVNLEEELTGTGLQPNGVPAATEPPTVASLGNDQKSDGTAKYRPFSFREMSRPKIPVAESPPSHRRGPVDNDASTLIVRNTKSLLNKLTIEKFSILTDKLANLLEEIKTEEELRTYVNIILEKVVLEPVFSEMYADLWQVLVWRCPQDIGKSSGVNPLTKQLLAAVQEAYVQMPRAVRLFPEEKASMEPEEIATEEKRRKSRWMGIVKLIGELFQRRMMSIKIIQSVVIDLVIGPEDPEEHFVECFAHLICTAGYYVDTTDKYRPLLDAWFGRLIELHKKKHYSKRLECIMQDVLDLRKSGWRKKSYRDGAKALRELRLQLETEEVLGGAIHAAQFGNIVVVGQRSNLETSGHYSEYINAQEQAYLARMKKQGLKPAPGG